MSESILNSTKNLTQKNLTELENSMDFTLDSYHNERIAYHMKMLSYYLKEQSNESMAN